MPAGVKNADLIISPRAVHAKLKARQSAAVSPADTFDRLLNREIQRQSGLKFSAHAVKRLESRNIHLSEQQRLRLSQAVEEAARKGVRDSLILLNRLAFIVNVKNRTVITAMDQAQMQEKGIFTNIDGAMILPDEA